MRLSVVVPVVIVTAAVVGAALYALSGGFSSDHERHGGSAPPSSTTTALPSSTLTTLAPVGPSTSAPVVTSSTTTTTSTTTTIAATTTTVIALPPSEVSVEVFNGSGEPGQASAVATALRALGFTIDGTANAANYDYKASELAYAPGSVAAAQSVAAHISGAYSLAIDSSLSRGVVELIVGSDYAGVRS